MNRKHDDFEYPPRYTPQDVKKYIDNLKAEIKSIKRKCDDMGLILCVNFIGLMFVIHYLYKIYNKLMPYLH